ncbi:hypothetical protein ACHAP5_011950 [Fusarium lateritium]
MESLGHSIAVAERLQGFIHSEVKATDNKVTSPQEAAEAKDAKAKALHAMKNTIMLVESTIARLRSTPDPPAKPKRSKGSLVHGTMNTSVEASELKRMNNFSSTTGLPSNAQSLVASMSGGKDGLGSQSSSLNEMATSIEPIVTSFDDVLSKPYLDKFSATLNTVPVVGLKNQQIMYLATKSSPLAKGGTQDVWTFFSALPDGVEVASDTNVHFFPYKGDFCLSVGTSVWRKRHRGADDPILKQAVGNWPKMYIDNWEKIGDNVLPSDKTLDIIPFAVLSADRNEIGFNLLLLNPDNSVQILTKDDLTDNNTWGTISYSKTTDSPDTVPTWARMAYWNGAVVGLDDTTSTWNVKINFDQSTYTISDKTAIKSSSEFTATDIGPVTVGTDGYLYKRFVQDPPSDGSDPQLQWSKWVLQDGVTKLGIASPGVILDLQVLTRTLKSRYIETQTSLYPVVNKIKAFAVTHNTYLDLLNKAAEEYANADDEKKMALAIKSGKGFVTHAKVWAKILNTSILNTKDTVNIMTSQLHDVKNQLIIQLQLLRDRLTGLQNTLKVQEESLSKLRAAFWGAVGAMFLGMALGVIALASGVGALAVVGAGALFIAGFVAVIALGVKMGELAGQISDTQAQIDVTNTAITELSAVVQNFTQLDELYSTLNVFWGRMANDANSLGTMDEATAAQLGADILEDMSSVIAAQGVTTEIGDAATVYLDTLNKQGIIIPSSFSAMTTERSPHQRVLTALKVPSSRELEDSFHDTIKSANESLSTGDTSSYEVLMEKAFDSELQKTHSMTLAQAQAGLWYDIPQINDASSIFNTPLAFPQGFSLFSMAGVDIDPAGVENRIRSAAPVVVGMLRNTDSMCQNVQNLLSQYKELPSGDKDGIARLKDTLLQAAIDDCMKAQSFAARSNNAFTDVNHAATDYQQGLERQVGALNDNGNSERASANEQMQNIDIPWYVYLGGVAAVLAYRASKVNDIQNDLNNRLGQIAAAIDQLRQAALSGATINGHAATWVETVQTISACLGGVYNILTAVQGQVLEDPTMYDSLLSVEWADVQKNTNIVFGILASRGIDINAPQSEKAFLTSSLDMPASTNDNARVAKALNAPDALDSTITSQASQAQDFFASMDKLLQSPYLAGIVGYWDEKQIEKTSLLDVATRLRTQYVDMMSKQYPVIEDLYTTSLLQQTRAQLVSEKKLSLEIMIRSSLRSARAGEKSARVAADKFRAGSANYATALKQIQANLSQIKSKMDEVDKNIGDLKKKERDLIISLIADVVALSLASAALLVGFGFLGPVATALTTVQALGLGAGATAAAIKTVVDSLNLADIEGLISALQSSKRDLDTSFNTLTTIRPLFINVVSAAEDIETTSSSIADTLQQIENNIELIKQTSLTEADVRNIGSSWTKIKNALTAWMDVVNAQGILPARS